MHVIAFHRCSKYYKLEQHVDAASQIENVFGSVKIARRINFETYESGKANLKKFKNLFKIVRKKEVCRENKKWKLCGKNSKTVAKVSSQNCYF